MEFLQIEAEYGWVIKVLESCETIDQITVAKNLYNNFIKKWFFDLSDERKIKLNYNFDRLSWTQRVKIKKNITN